MELFQKVYIAGFSTDQEKYDKAVQMVFDRLDRLDKMLQGKKYLVSDRLTYCDIRLFQFLIRFDSVYYFHFKCNKKPLRKFDNLNRYVQTLYVKDMLGQFVDMEHIKRHYYRSHKTLNRKGIIPQGPEPWWEKDRSKHKKR